MGKLLVVDFKKWMELDSSKVLETWLSQFLVTSRSFSYLSLPALIGIEEWMLRKNLDSWFCRNVVGMTSKVPEQTSTGRTMKPDLKEEERSRFWVAVVFPSNASEVDHFQGRVQIWRTFDTLTKHLKSYLVNWKILCILWQFISALGQFSVIVNGQKFKNKINIW